MSRLLCLSFSFLVLATVTSVQTQQLSARVPEMLREQSDLPAGAILRLGSPELRVGGRVNGLIVLEGGKRIATLGDRELIVWETATGRPVSWSELPPTPKTPRGVVLQYPAGWGLSATADGSALISIQAGNVSRHPLPLEQGAPIPLPQPVETGDAFIAVAPADKGDVVLGVTTKGSLLKWQPDDRKWTALDSPALGEKPTVARGGGILAIVEKESRVRLWDVTKGKSVGLQDVEEIKTVAVSSDGKRFVTAATRFRAKKLPVVEVRTVPDRKNVASWEVRTAPSVLALSADGTLAAVGFPLKNQVELYEVATGKLRHTLTTPDKSARFIAFLSNGESVVTVGDAGIAQIWDTTTGKLRHPETGHLGGVRTVRALGKGWVSAGADGVVICWNADGKEVRRLEGHKGAVTGLVVSRGGRTIFSAGLDCTVREWDAETGKERRNCLVAKGPTQTIHALALSSDGKWLAGGVRGGELRLLDTRELKVVKSLRPKTAAIGALTPAAEFASNDLLVSRDSRRNIRIWDIGEKGELRQIEALGSVGTESARLSVSPNGKTVVSPLVREGLQPALEKLAVATEVGIWDVESGKLLDRIKTDAKAGITALTYLNDGKALAVGDASGTVWVIELEKKAVRHTFKGHRGPVLSLAVSPDGKTLSSGGADTTVLVWDLTKP